MGSRGPKATGSVERTATGWVARLRLADGSRARVPIPVSYDTEEKAREFAAALVAREAETGVLVARRRAAKGLAPMLPKPRHASIAAQISAVTEPPLPAYNGRCTVYFINVEGGMTKIGTTKNGALARARQAQTMHWRRISIVAELPGDEENEKRYHRIYEHCHALGEWFDLPKSELLCLHEAMSAERKEWIRNDNSSLFALFERRVDLGHEASSPGRTHPHHGAVYVPPWWLA